jgi:hypothetical protein
MKIVDYAMKEGGQIRCLMVWENKRITKVNMKVSMCMVKNMERVNSLGMMAHIFKEHFKRVYFLVQGY